MTAARTGSPLASTATVPDHCAVHTTPRAVAGSTAASSRARRVAVTIAVHHAPGSCSAPPPGRSRVGTGSWALAAMAPLACDEGGLGPTRAEVHGQDERPVLARAGRAGTDCGDRH